MAAAGAATGEEESLICQYCRATNDDENHRCNLCGRRLGDLPSRGHEMFPVQQSAAAPVVEQISESPRVDTPPAAGPQLVTELAKAPAGYQHAIQASLFGPQEVIKRVAPPRKQPAPQTPRVKRDRSSQQALDFDAPPEASKTLPTSVEAAVYCNAPVAIPMHRVVAGALDVAIVLIAIGVFLGTFHLAGHEIVLTKMTVPVYAAVAVLISLFYRILFCVAEADTFGTHWSGLRLLNFDGRRPSRRERLCRTAGACVSLIALGVGFVWAIVDEERLSWHDYMSKTFPSPRSF
jgi:uncharacterized RDD family membrane protein YckC